MLRLLLYQCEEKKEQGSQVKISNESLDKNNKSFEMLGFDFVMITHF